DHTRPKASPTQTELFRQRTTRCDRETSREKKPVIPHLQRADPHHFLGGNGGGWYWAPSCSDGRLLAGEGHKPGAVLCMVVVYSRGSELGQSLLADRHT
ncbi:MAG: hypothetical protein ABGX22_21970, partial [Pirellulaceae bacterium]